MEKTMEGKQTVYLSSSQETARNITCYWKDMWQKLNIMRQMWQLCDITLFSNDNSMFMAHSPVLAASSEIFHNFFVTKTDKNIEAVDGNSKLLIPNMSSDILQVTLDFIYGNMPNNVEDFEKLKRGADVLGLHGALNFLNHAKGTFLPSVCPVSSSDDLKTTTKGEEEDADLNEQCLLDAPKVSKMKAGDTYLSDTLHISKQMADENLKKELTMEANDDAALAILYSEKPLDLNSLAVQKCPFTGLKGTTPHGNADEFLTSTGHSGTDLLTEVSLADLYPQLMKRKCGRRRKKLKRLLQSHQQHQEFARKESSSESEEDSIDEERALNNNNDPENENKGSKACSGSCKSLVVKANLEIPEQNEKSCSDVPSETKDVQIFTNIKKKKKRNKPTNNTPVDEEAERENFKIIKQLERISSSGKIKYKCLVEGCSYTNKKLDFMQSHLFHYHNIGKPSKLCPICDHAYFSTTQLNTHIRRSHDQTNAMKQSEYICPDCGDISATVPALRLHQIKAHVKGTLFTCDDCEFKSPRKKDMQSHMLSKHNKVAPGVRVFDCLYCDYRCLDRNRHLEHSAKHTGEQKYLCPLCGKAYTTRRGMRTHIKYHSEERPHNCTMCEAKFKVRSKLKDHMRLRHTEAGIKAYKCAYCSHQTALRGNCNQHIRKYHANMPIAVIDQLAHSRQCKKNYNYSKIAGISIEERKDVSAAMWASVGSIQEDARIAVNTDTAGEGLDPKKHDADVTGNHIDALVIAVENKHSTVRDITGTNMGACKNKPVACNINTTNEASKVSLELSNEKGLTTEM